MNRPLSQWFQQIVLRARELVESRDGDPVPAIMQDCHELISSRGEATGLALASGIFVALGQLDAEQLTEFVMQLERQLGVDHEELAAAIDRYQSDPDAVVQVHKASEPMRQELFRRLNSAPNGTVELIRLRERILDLEIDRAIRRRVDQDFVHLFSSWFNKGFLTLTQVDWTTPADLLEKLIQYESVHEIQGWDDLRRRLAGDRRCFAYMHPAVPNEPLIFVEVALVKGISSAITPLLAEPESDPVDADTAVFYSINNCQRGLAQVSFGNFLIKQVVHQLREQLPQLKTFVTLSPIPGFRRWAEQQEILIDPIEDPANARIQCLDYLLTMKNGRPLDPVARFHLGNGARLEQIHLEADPSQSGQARSFGMMVNYLYDADQIVANHEALLLRGEVATSGALKSLQKQLKSARNVHG